MKKVLGLILCIVNVLCMTGCYSGEQTYDYTIFFLSEDENELIAEGFDSEAQSVDAIITEMLEISTLDYIFFCYFVLFYNIYKKFGCLITNICCFFKIFKKDFIFWW